MTPKKVLFTEGKASFLLLFQIVSRRFFFRLMLRINWKKERASYLMSSMKKRDR
jgi:hypothetical protein